MKRGHVAGQRKEKVKVEKDADDKNKQICFHCSIVYDAETILTPLCKTDL